jgi:hypothetical protein
VCRGKGWVEVDRGWVDVRLPRYRPEDLDKPVLVFLRRPCPECNGCGVASCCDAAGSAQPEPVLSRVEGPAWPYLINKECRDGGDGAPGGRLARRLRGGG